MTHISLELAREDQCSPFMSNRSNPQTKSFRSAEKCRTEAVACRRLANAASDPKKRAHYFNLAKLWAHTAAELDSQSTQAKSDQSLTK